MTWDPFVQHVYIPFGHTVVETVDKPSDGPELRGGVIIFGDNEEHRTADYFGLKPLPTQGKAVLTRANFDIRFADQTFGHINLEAISEVNEKGIRYSIRFFDRDFAHPLLLEWEPADSRQFVETLGRDREKPRIRLNSDGAFQQQLPISNFSKVLLRDGWLKIRDESDEILAEVGVPAFRDISDE